jgi:hypothetical protein
MTTSSRWWFGAFVVVVFLAGTSVGVIVDRSWLIRGAIWERRQIAGDVRGRFGADGVAAEAGGVVVANGTLDINIRRLRNRLNLTPEQEAVARPLVQAWMDRVRTLQQGTREQLVDEVAGLEAALSELSPALTVEQRQQLTSLRSVLLMPAPPRGRGRLGAPDGGRAGRGGPLRDGRARQGGAGRE